MSVEILWVHRFKWITELSSNCESRAPSRWWSASVILFHVLGAGHFCPFCSRRKMDGAAAIELEWNLKKCSISSTATYQKFSFIFTATWREKKIRKVYVTGHNSELVDQDVDPPPYRVCWKPDLRLLGAEIGMGTIHARFFYVQFI